MKLKELRKNLKQTQEEVAAKTNIPREKYNRIENQTTKTIEIETLCKLADYYNVSLDYLVGRNFKNEVVISNNKKELHLMIEQLSSTNYFRAKIYIAGLLAGQN